MKKTINLTEDHIKLIKNIKFEAFTLGELFNTEVITDAIKEIENNPDYMKKWGYLRDNLVYAKDKLETISDLKECNAWGINQWNLFGGSYVMEDVALILGHYGDYYKGTEESPLGKQYPKELEDYWWGLYLYIVENIVNIFNIMFYFLDKGGLKPGKYTCNSKNTYDWIYSE